MASSSASIQSATTSGKAPTIASRLKRVLVLPYVIGTVWAFLLPTASILTGDFTRPRGWYVDENSLETSSIRPDYKYRTISRSDEQETTHHDVSLCDVVVEDILDKNNIDCHRHGSNSNFPSFDLVSILPTGTTLDPSNEAIALVAPHPTSGNWTTSPFHFTLLELLRRLASADSIPWLAKTIYMISPTSKESSLHDVVNAFLESYAGSYQSKSNGQAVIEHLPPRMSNAMIRNLLVLDNRHSKDLELTNDEVRILPQGNLGVLPNMDLVFVTMTVFSRKPSTFTARRSSNDAPKILMHPYSQEAQQWEKFVKEKLEGFFVHQKVEKWALNLGNLAMFCQNLWQGPYAPHSFALDRGIDAITIQGRYIENFAKPSTFVVDYVQKLEVTLRGLSNLHERLHHSTRLYLLPSPLTFVKHEEYLVPNLLPLIPVVFRAALLGLVDIRRFDLQVVGWICLIMVMATFWLDAYVAQKEAAERNAWFCLVYAASLLLLYEKVLKIPRDLQDALQSAQLLICLLTIYSHVPISFGNVAVAFPSAFFWAPCVAFPLFASLFQGKIGTVCMLAWLVCTWPPIAPINELLGDNLYVRFVYCPLHLALSLSCLLGILQTPP